MTDPETAGGGPSASGSDGAADDGQRLGAGPHGRPVPGPPARPVPGPPSGRPVPGPPGAGPGAGPSTGAVVSGPGGPLTGEAGSAPDVNVGARPAGETDAADPTRAPSSAPTGDAGPLPGEEAITAQLDALGGLPVNEHVAVFEAVHRSLQETLAAVDGS